MDTQNRATKSGVIRIVGIVVVVALLFLAAYIGSRPAQAQEETPTPTPITEDEGTPTPLPPGDEGAAETDRTVSTTGTGTVSVAPDRAVVVLGVMTETEMASDAMSETNDLMQDVVDALIEAGVDEDNIQTRVIQLQPRYEQQQGPQPGPSELIGFRAVNLVEVTLTDAGMFGDVLDAAVEAGANLIETFEFEISDPADALEDARSDAWDDAESKAQQLADLAGATLGPVVSINEFTQGPIPFGRGGDIALEQAASAPVQPGQQTVRVELQVTWSLR